MTVAGLEGTENAVRVLLWHWGRRGGGPRFTLELARALAQSDAAAIHLSLSQQSELYDEIRGLGLPGWHIGTYQGPWSAAVSSLRVPWLARGFSRYITEQRIDIVVSVMDHIWTPFVVPSVQRAGAKVLSIIHDGVPHDGDAFPGRHFLHESNINRSDAIVYLSEHVRQVVEQRYAGAKKRSWVIPHGVFDYSGTQTDSRRYPSDRAFRLLFFGRVLPYKGLDITLDAVERLQKARPVELLIAGLGDLGPYREALKRVKSSRVINRWIGESEIEAVLQWADLVVLSHREASQSGIVPLAYAAGLPVVATPVGGLKEQVIPNKTGLLATAPDGAALASALETMMSDPVLYESCSRGALEYGRAALSWQHVGDCLLQAVREVGCEGAVLSVGM